MALLLPVAMGNLIEARKRVTSFIRGMFYLKQKGLKFDDRWNEGPQAFPRGDNNHIVKIFTELIFSKTTEPISIEFYKLLGLGVHW